MTLYSAAELLGRVPHPGLLVRSGGPLGLAKLQRAEARDLLIRSLSGIPGEINTELITAAPSTPPTLVNLYIQITAGRARVGGIYERFAAQDDYDLLVESFYELDGTDGVVPSADGKTYWLLIVACLVDGTVTLVALKGDEADDASEVEPSDEELAAALRDAAAIASSDIEDLEPEAGAFIVAMSKVQRVAVDTMTITDLDPASDDPLASYRSRTNLFGVVAPA